MATEAEARRRTQTVETMGRPDIEIPQAVNLPARREPRTDTDALTDTRRKLTPDEIDTLRRKYAEGASDAEFNIFIRVAERTGLDPFTEQIRFLKRQKKEKYRDAEGKWQDRWVDTFSIQVGIDGFRLVATRTGKYQGQTPVQWCGKNGVWMEVWVENAPPTAARVGVYRRGFTAPLYAVAHFREYAQRTGDRLIRQWANMPANQLAKCAEALALRKAFPQELAGLYTGEEMDQATNDETAAPAPRTETPRPAAKPAAETETASNGHRSEAAEDGDVIDPAYRATFLMPFGNKKGDPITSPDVSIGLLLGAFDWCKQPERVDEYHLWLEATTEEITQRVLYMTKADMASESFVKTLAWAMNAKRAGEYAWFVDYVNKRAARLEGEQSGNPTDDSPSDSAAGSTTD